MQYAPRSLGSNSLSTYGPGNLLVLQKPDLEPATMLSQIDPKRIQAIVTKLVFLGTRHKLSNQADPVRGIGAVRDWIISEMLRPRLGIWS